MSSTSLQCPSCGRQCQDIDTMCECGFIADSSFVEEYENRVERPVTARSQKNTEKPKNLRHPTATKREREASSATSVLKEIDSWQFLYSPDDDCVYLGTPALQSFKLKLTYDDLEELLEELYDKTGQEKTTRKLNLSTKEINEIVDNVYKMIEEKRSKLTVKFSDDELQQITDLINARLKA